ncbi:hypothetical protein Hanom_Chr03g00216051 [Helianthus anomalus]
MSLFAIDNYGRNYMLYFFVHACPFFIRETFFRGMEISCFIAGQISLKCLVAGSSEKDIVTLGFQGHVPPIQRVVLEVFPQLRLPHHLPLLWAVFFQKLLRYLPNLILLIRVK